MGLYNKLKTEKNLTGVQEQDSTLVLNLSTSLLTKSSTPTQPPSWDDPEIDLMIDDALSQVLGELTGEPPPDPLADFSELPINPQPCSCGSPFFWLTIYDLTGLSPHCRYCKPAPSPSLVGAHLQILTEIDSTEDASNPKILRTWWA